MLSISIIYIMFFLHLQANSSFESLAEMKQLAVDWLVTYPNLTQEFETSKSIEKLRVSERFSGSAGGVSSHAAMGMSAIGWLLIAYSSNCLISLGWLASIVEGDSIIKGTLLYFNFTIICLHKKYSLCGVHKLATRL